MQKNNVSAQGIGEGIDAEFVWQYFKDVDTMDPSKVTQHYSPDGSFRFANEKAVTGKEALEQVLSQFYGQIKSMNHVNTGLWLGNRSAVFQAEVEFKKKNGDEVRIPAVSILHVDESRKVKRFEFVMDASPLSK